MLRADATANGLKYSDKDEVRHPDQLKAILYNCSRHGPKSQNINDHPNFKAHLRGRIAYVSWLNPSRGQKLHGLWDRISWDE